MRTRALLSLAGMVLALPGSGPTDRAGDPARTFLTTSFGLNAVDLRRIDQGQVVSRTLGVSDRREVATLGVVRVRVTPEFYAHQLADITNFKRDESVLQIGTFGSPPELQDVSGLTLEDSDIRSLRSCRVGRCGVQLSADAIDYLREGIDWRSPDPARQANSLMGRMLVEYVTRYRESGTAASMQYADRSEPVHLGREFLALVESDIGGLRHFPTLRRHLLEYPAGNTPGTTELIYWSKEKVGRRAVVSVTHLTICRTANESPADYAIASKHIYGTHYFDASLGLTILLRDRASAPPAMYLAYVNRSRVDAFEGLFGGLVRKAVGARARSTVAHQLGRLQRTLEQLAAGETS